MSSLVTSDGYFTMLKYLFDQSPALLESRLGFPAGLLSAGWSLLAPVKPIAANYIDLRGSTRWPNGMLDDGRLVSSLFQADLATSREKVGAFLKSGFDNQPAKVAPKLGIKVKFPEASVPIPQFKLSQAIHWAKICDVRPGQLLRRVDVLPYSGRASRLVPPGVIRYNAAEELLSGTIGSQIFRFRAYSGGGRGSIDPAVWQQTVQSRLSTTKKTNAQRGGVIPAGWYSCEHLVSHYHFGECIRLNRTASSSAIYSPFSAHPIPHFRDDDFFIHGRGEQGSDGCIVPEHKSERVRLNRAIADFEGRVYLLVSGSGYMLPAERGGLVS